MVKESACKCRGYWQPGVGKSPGAGNGKVKVTQSSLTFCNHSPCQNTGVGSLSLLQGIFLTQESNWGLLHCGWILYQLSYCGSPRKWQPFPVLSPVFWPGKFHGQWSLVGFSMGSMLMTEHTHSTAARNFRRKQETS